MILKGLTLRQQTGNLIPETMQKRREGTKRKDVDSTQKDGLH